MTDEMEEEFKQTKVAIGNNIILNIFEMEKPSLVVTDIIRRQIQLHPPEEEGGEAAGLGGRLGGHLAGVGSAQTCMEKPLRNITGGNLRGVDARVNSLLPEAL